LYVDGSVSPANPRLTRGLPSVDAIAIPPLLAVVSVGENEVPSPTTISGSDITNC
jgi:hypothetical protein